MAETDNINPGSNLWQDLTISDAEGIRDFYKAVVGWEARDHEMEGYNDFEMRSPATGETVAGICHARGENADIPPVWLIYITVEDVAAATTRCVEMGGQVIAGPRAIGDAHFCVIRDPAGAVCAFYRP